MANYALYDVSVDVLTPLHIGNGRTLLHEYDYAIRSKRTWRINEWALLDAQQADDLAAAEVLARTRPAQLLTGDDFQTGSGLFRYVIEGTPRSAAEGAELREQMKTIDDRPYLPGSALKGALRTGLLWHGWAARGIRRDVQMLNPRREFAAQRFEREVAGRDPNHDLLRALHVADSEPVGADRLLVANARVMGRNGVLAAPIEMEALRPDTVFSTTIKVDRQLFSRWAQEGGNALRNGEWLEQLPGIMQKRAEGYVKRELAWYKTIPNATRLEQFYQQLAGSRLGKGRFLVQLGWGTGWESKTFGEHLQEPAFIEHLLRTYRLARGRRNEGDPFPKSRRVLVGVTRDTQGRTQEVAALPFGWCLVEMKERKQS